MFSLYRVGGYTTGTSKHAPSASRRVSAKKKAQDGPFSRGGRKGDCMEEGDGDGDG